MSKIGRMTAMQNIADGTAKDTFSEKQNGLGMLPPEERKAAAKKIAGSYGHSTRKPKTKLRDFWDRLDKHDWLYSMSDDQSVWRRGVTEQAALQEIAKESASHKKMYDAFNSTDKKPRRPR